MGDELLEPAVGGDFSAAAGSDPRVARALRRLSVVLSTLAAVIALGVISVRVAVTAAGEAAIDDRFTQIDLFSACAIAAAAAAVLAASGSRRVMTGVHRGLCLLSGGIAVWALGLAGTAVTEGNASGVGMATAVTVGLASVAAASLATPRLTVYVGQGAAAAAITLSAANLAQYATELRGVGDGELPLIVAITVPMIAVAALFARPRLGAMRVLSAGGQFGRLARRLLVAAMAAPFVFSVALTELAGRQITGEELFGAYVALLLVLLGGFTMVPLTAAAHAVARAGQLEEQRRRDIEAGADARELTAALSAELAVSVTDNDEWQVRARSEPASGHLAGDVVFADSDEGRLWLIVLDVTGHGPAAALFASWAKHQLRSALEAGDGPALALRGLEQICRAHNEVATAFVAVSSGDGMFTYASAGHPPAIVAGGSHIERLGATGPLVGAWAETWVERQVQLRVGDCVVVVSDGILEARGRGGVEWGAARLESIALHRVAEGGEVVAEAVLDDARSHTSGRFSDDATVVVVARQR